MQWQLFAAALLLFIIGSAEVEAADDDECQAPLFFKCHNTTKCISYVFVCDGENDCGDNSDENDCGNNSDDKIEQSFADVCKEPDFQCVDGFDCIPEDRHCDGKQDCIDGSDELNCSAKIPLPTCLPTCKSTPKGCQCTSSASHIFKNHIYRHFSVLSCCLLLFFYQL